MTPITLTWAGNEAALVFLARLILFAVVLLVVTQAGVLLFLRQFMGLAWLRRLLERLGHDDDEDPRGTPGGQGFA